MRGAARERFDAEGAAAGENVEHRESFEIEPHQQPREDRFAHPRGRGTGGQSGRGLELPAARMSGNYLHLKKCLRSPNIFTNNCQRDR